MRIAVIHTQPLSAREAGVAFVTGAATGLAQAGADVSLLVPAGNKEIETALTSLGAPLEERLRVDTLPRIHLALGPFHPSWSARFRRTVVKRLRATKVDIAIVRDLKLAAALCAAKLPCRIVYEMHNVYTLGQEDPEALRLFPEKKLRMHQARVDAEAEVLMAVDGAIALTDGLRIQLEPLFGLNGRVVAAGSALHPTEPTTKNEAPTDIAYIGSLDPHKGVGMIVEALRTLPEPIRLLLIGHGRHSETLQNLAQNLGVENRLKMGGWYSPAELPAALCNCFAAAVPLEDCFYNRFVTSPMKLFDYARAGVVPVVPRLPVFNELFIGDKGAVVVGEPSARHFGAVLHRLFQDFDYRRQKEKELADFAATHTWQVRGEKLLPFFAGLEKRKTR